MLKRIIGAAVVAFFVPAVYADNYLECSSLDYLIEEQNNYDIDVNPQIYSGGSWGSAKSLVKDGIVTAIALGLIEIAEFALTDNEDNVFQIMLGDEPEEGAASTSSPSSYFSFQGVAGSTPQDACSNYVSSKYSWMLSTSGAGYKGAYVEHKDAFYCYGWSSSTESFAAHCTGFMLPDDYCIEEDLKAIGGFRHSGAEYTCVDSSSSYCQSSEPTYPVVYTASAADDDYPDSVCYKTGSSSYGRVSIDNSTNTMSIENILQFQNSSGDTFYDYEKTTIDNETRTVKDYESSTSTNSSPSKSDDNFPTDYAREKTLKDIKDFLSFDSSQMPSVEPSDLNEPLTDLKNDILDTDTKLGSIPFYSYLTGIGGSGTCQGITYDLGRLGSGTFNSHCPFINDVARPAIGFLFSVSTLLYLSFLYRRETTRGIGA